MKNPDHVSTLKMCGDLMAFIGTRLQEVYDAAPSRDYLFCDELSVAIGNADKMTLIIRTLEQISERGTEVKFSAEQAAILDQLERSRFLPVKTAQDFTLNRAVVKFRKPAESIGYIPEDSAS